MIGDNSEAWCKEHNIQKVTPRLVNIAVLTYNALEDTKRFLESIYKNTNIDFNIWFLDNSSKDETPQWLKSQQHNNLYYKLSSKNWGVPGGRNRLIEMINPYLPEDGFIVFMDNDLELLPNWSEISLDFLQDHPEAGMLGVVGCQIQTFDGLRLLYPPPTESGEVDILCGGFVCWISAKTIRDVGHFDEKLGIFWHEDDDYSVRAVAKGHRQFAVPHIPVIHHEHASGAADDGVELGGSPKNQTYLVKKWQESGITDEYGFVVHQIRPAYDFSKREFEPNLFVEGMTRSFGGYNVLAPKARFTFTAGSLQQAKFLTFDLQSFEKSSYDTNNPLQAKILINGNLVHSLEFREEQETIPVKLSIPNSEHECCVEIISDFSLNPFMSDLSSWETRAVSLRISGLRTETSNLPTQSLEKYIPSQETREKGTQWTVPIFTFSKYGNFIRELVRENTYRTSNIEPIQTDLNFKTILNSILPEKLFWREALEKEIEVKNKVLTLPPTANQKLHFLEQEIKNTPPEVALHTIFTAARANASSDWTSFQNSLTSIWATGTHSKNVLEKLGVSSSKIEVLPLSVNPELYNPNVLRPTEHEGFRKFNIIAEVDLTESDGWEYILLSYLSSFTAKDDVCLILRTYTNKLSNSDVRETAEIFASRHGINKNEMPKIEVIHVNNHYLCTPSYFKSAHCYLDLGKENLVPNGILLAYAIGLPVLATNWGDRADYLNDNIAFPIAFQEQKSKNDMCVIPNWEQAGKILRELYLNPRLAQSRVQKAKDNINTTWSSETTRSFIESKLNSQNHSANIALSRSFASLT